MADETKDKGGALFFARPSEDTLHVRVSGEWKLSNALPSADEVIRQAAAGPKVHQITFETTDIKGWDSGLLIFLVRLGDLCRANGIHLDLAGLPHGVQRLLSLSSAVPERKGARREAGRFVFLEQAGIAAIGAWRSSCEILAFIGDAVTALIRLFARKAKFRRSDLFLTMQECGSMALPIVSLISVLVGLILAFVGAIQLKMFGAQIYVASLVGIAMVRVMGAIMTGIIMAGRTGAAFAAQLGTMQVNEEIDALKTMGFSPMEFLVLPRLLALFVMMPLLCIYADLMGIIGGFIVGVGMLDLGVIEYFNQTKAAVRLVDLWVGLFHSAVFGAIVAMAGCLRGMQCGRSASAVGDATTSAVVTSIVSIIVATAIITVVCNVLGI